MNSKLKHSFWFHLGIVLALCTLLYISFFASLHCFTKHGQEVVIPAVRGKNVSAAIDLLKGMHFEVAVDSTYEPSQKPLTVLKQLPDTGSVVKEGRTVFLTVNMLNPPHIPMPNLVSLSFRSALMLLRNNKLILGDTTFKPDIASGAILEQLYNGKPIRQGELVAQGSKISLVIGNGLGNTEIDVPDVTNQPVDVVLDIIAQNNLQYIISVANEAARITDTPSAIVVDQEPRQFNEAGGHNRIKAGDFISIIIDQNPDPDAIRGNRNPSKSVNTNNETNKEQK